LSPILESIGYKSSNKWNDKPLLSEPVQYSISNGLHESWKRTESEKEICGTIIITDNGTVFALKSQLIISDTFSIWILCIVVLLVTGTSFLGWSASLELRFFHMKEEEAAPQVSISGCDFQTLLRNLIDLAVRCATLSRKSLVNNIVNYSFCFCFLL
jgi:hypothetical protein